MIKLGFTLLCHKGSLSIPEVNGETFCMQLNIYNFCQIKKRSITAHFDIWRNKIKKERRG